MNKLRHRIQISIANHKGEREHVVSGTALRFPRKLLKMLFGDGTHILVITPGRTVDEVEIKEVEAGGEHGESE